MPSESEPLSCYPDHVAVVGGGRWARVVIDVLSGVVPSSVAVSAHSLHNADSMCAWARGLARRIDVSAAWPRVHKGRSTAVIVANAARHHEVAADYALSVGMPVLVEKPIALTAAAARRLAQLAADRHVRFAAAHVFLFARYLDHFAGRVANAGPLQSVRITWTDPYGEDRYGESKTYDSSLPIISDVLPHVVSMIGALTAIRPDRCRIAEFRRGGASVELTLMSGEVPCSILMERKSDRRRRLLVATAGQSTLDLDFSKEPGTISDGVTTVGGDANWDIRPRPLARMLTSFLRWVATGEHDRRLDLEIGLRACDVIDETMAAYRAAMMSWLRDRRSATGEVEDDVQYARNEMLQYDRSLLASALQGQVRQS